MGTVPNPRTWVSEQVTAAKLNADVRDSYNFLIATPHAVLRKSSNQVIASGAETAITWEVEVVDSDGGHSTVSNTSRYTAQTAGWYHVTATLAADCSANTGMREIVIRKNGDGNTRQGRQDFWPAPNGSQFDRYYLTTATHVFLNVNDYIELMHFQSSGTNATAGPVWHGLRNELEVRWVRA
jgi:hypothetical protein